MEKFQVQKFPAISLQVVSVLDSKTFTIGHDSLPHNFDSFLEHIVRNFKKTLPSNFYLEYEDTDGDKVMLTTEDDYVTMFSFRDQDGSISSIKILINEAKIPDDNDKIITLSAHLQKILDEPEPEPKKEPEQAGSADSGLHKQPLEELKDQENRIHKKDQAHDELEDAEETVVIRMKSSADAPDNSERKAEINSIQRAVTERKVQAITLKLMKDYLPEMTWMAAQKISEEVPDIKIPKSRLENMLFLAKIASGKANIPKPAEIKIKSIEIKAKSDEELVQESIRKFKEPMYSKKEEPVPMGDSNLFAPIEEYHPIPVKKVELIQPKPWPVYEPKIQQPILYQEDPNSLLNAVLKQHIGTVPTEPQDSESYIYSTVVLVNNGKKPWPRGAMVVSCCELKGENATVPEIPPGQHFTCVLITKNPGKAGNYTSVWGFRYHTDAGQPVSFGNPIIVEFSVKKSGGQAIKGKVSVAS